MDVGRSSGTDFLPAAGGDTVTLGPESIKLLGNICVKYIF